MPTYEQLKNELLEIVKIVEKFPEQVKPKVFDLLVKEFLGEKQPQKETPPEEKNATEKPAKPTKLRKAVSKESYAIDRNLDLQGNDSIPSFKEFFKKKNPKSANEFNAVAVYYLQKMLEIQRITLDHVYTCYAEVSKKPPQYFKQSLIDTKNKRGWVEFDDAGNLNIPHRGVVSVEHELPKPEKEIFK